MAIRYSDQAIGYFGITTPFGQNPSAGHVKVGKIPRHTTSQRTAGRPSLGGRPARAVSRSWRASAQISVRMRQWLPIEPSASCTDKEGGARMAAQQAGWWPDTAGLAGRTSGFGAKSGGIPPRGSSRSLCVEKKLDSEPVARPELPRCSGRSINNGPALIMH